MDLSVLQELEAIKARVREMEEEAEKLKELQNEVEKQMNLSPPPGAFVCFCKLGSLFPLQIYPHVQFLPYCQINWSQNYERTSQYTHKKLNYWILFSL